MEFLIYKVVGFNKLLMENVRNGVHVGQGRRAKKSLRRSHHESSENKNSDFTEPREEIISKEKS